MSIFPYLLIYFYFACGETTKLVINIDKDSIHTWIRTGGPEGLAKAMWCGPWLIFGLMECLRKIWLCEIKSRSFKVDLEPP